MKSMKNFKYLPFILILWFIYSCNGFCTGPESKLLTSEQIDFLLDSTRTHFTMKDQNGITDTYRIDTSRASYPSSKHNVCGPEFLLEQAVNEYKSSIYSNYIRIAEIVNEDDDFFEITMGSTKLVYCIKRKKVDQAIINSSKDIKAEVSYSDKETINGKEYRGNYTVQLDKTNPNLPASEISTMVFAKHFGMIKLVTKAGQVWLREP